jgi:hypothetical protein
MFRNLSLAIIFSAFLGLPTVFAQSCPTTQPTNLSTNTNTVVQGGSFTLALDPSTPHICNVDVEYHVGTGPDTIAYGLQLDSQNKVEITTDALWQPGTYTFTRIRNSLTLDVITTLPTPVSVEVQIRQPGPSASFSPAVINQSECVTWTVENGATMLLDVQYRVSNGPINEVLGWPSLDAYGNGLWGRATICTSAGMTPGVYAFEKMRNHWSTQPSDYVTLSPPSSFQLLATPIPKKEYTYLGNRLIVVERSIERFRPIAVEAHTPAGPTIILYSNYATDPDPLASTYAEMQIWHTSCCADYSWLILSNFPEPSGPIVSATVYVVTDYTSPTNGPVVATHLRNCHSYSPYGQCGVFTSSSDLDNFSGEKYRPKAIHSATIPAANFPGGASLYVGFIQWGALLGDFNPPAKYHIYDCWIEYQY